jgi:hypothetical protein
MTNPFAFEAKAGRTKARHDSNYKRHSSGDNCDNFFKAEKHFQ